ncbi:MAG: hypothetical protein FJW38_25445 [Acidobacteria bacterium]|nr:hypothetical protein [Acidobacteriota bacterium]
MSSKARVGSAGLIATLLSGCGAGLFETRPLGDSVRTADSIATLLVTEQPSQRLGRMANRPVQLHVLLSPLDGKTPPRKIAIAGKLEELETRNTAKLLGSDGRYLWLLGNSITAVELATGKLITAPELEKINPALAGQWLKESKYYEVKGRLRFTTADARKFELDQVSLQTRPYVEPPKPKLNYREDMERYNREMSMWGIGLEKFFWSGGFVTANDWFGLHTPDEADRNHHVGSRVTGESRNSRVDGRRLVYRAKIEACPLDFCLTAISPLPGEGYIGAALLRDETQPRPLRLTEPDGFVMLHWSKLGKEGTLLVSRIGFDGKVAWNVDTGFVDIDQVFPGTPAIAFIGKGPAPANRVAELGLVMIDTGTGQTNSRLFRQN